VRQSDDAPNGSFTRWLATAAAMSHFLGHHVEVHTCAQDFVAVLILWRNLFKDHRRIVEHSQLGISAARKACLWQSLFKESETLGGRKRERLRGHPEDQQESDRHDSQHYERPEMMILRLPGAVGVFLPLTAWQEMAIRKVSWPTGSLAVCRQDSRPRIGVSSALAARTGSKYSRRNAILSPTARRNST
jgi:hypothetical protein